MKLFKVKKRITKSTVLGKFHCFATVVVPCIGPLNTSFSSFRQFSSKLEQHFLRLFSDAERALIDQFGENIRVSFGIGVAIRLGHMARIEVNYCFPHQYDPSDRPQPGVQFGIGVQFL